MTFANIRLFVVLEDLDFAVEYRGGGVFIGGEAIEAIFGNANGGAVIDDLEVVVFEQTIGFDETTSFKRGRIGRGMGMGEAGAGNAPANPPAVTGESITLADIKVGDNVSGTGSVKSGVFVPAQLTVAAPGQGRRREGQPQSTPAETPGPGTK